MATLFTADSHFSDDSIRRVCRRPFDTVDDMNRTMIELWNSRVRPADTVWHLGDFSMHGKAAEVAGIFAALNGRKLLVRGNHDRRRVLDLPWAAPPVDIADVSVDGARLILCHYAFRSWKGAFRGSLMLYGHTHDLLPPSRQSCDVGADSWAYAPVTLDQIRSRLSGVAEEPEEIRLARARAAERGEG